MTRTIRCAETARHFSLIFAAIASRLYARTGARSQGDLSVLQIVRGKRTAVRLAAVAFILAISASAYAQSTLRGTVSDPLGAVVKDAKVTLLRGDASASDTTTDGQGTFTFSPV